MGQFLRSGKVYNCFYLGIQIKNNKRKSNIVVIHLDFLYDDERTIREDDHSQLHSETPWIVVAPTYAWKIPRILEKCLEQVQLAGNRRTKRIL